MRLVPSVVLATLVVVAACGGATTPQEPVVEPYAGEDGGNQDAPGSTEPECIAGETACMSSCTDTQSDPQHCGTCGKVCGKGTYCSEGVCSPGDGGGGGFGFGGGDGGGHRD